MATQTTNYDFLLPAVNSPTDEDLWGDELNDNFTSLDSLLYTATNRVTETKTANYTVISTDSNKVLLVDATSGNLTISLTAVASLFNGFTFAVKKTDATANTVTIDPAGAETIDGASSYVLSAQNDSVLVSARTTGSTWWVTASNLDIDIPNASTTERGIIEIATNAEVKTRTDTDRAVVPSSVYHHPGVAKAWVKFTGSSGTIGSSYNITSVTRNSTGNYTIVMTTALADTDYTIHIGVAYVNTANTNGSVVSSASVTTTTFTIQCQGGGGTNTDPAFVYVTVHGNAA